MAIGLALTLAVLISVPYFQSLVHDLSHQAEYRFSLRDLQVPPKNKWVPDDLLARLILSKELPETVSLLDAGIAKRVGQVLERDPWVRRVHSIRITGEPSLQAYLEFRRPVMFVASPDGNIFAVDADGVVLPPGDFNSSHARDLPLMKNVRTQPAAAGQAWPDPSVVAAARLADALCPGNDMNQVWNPFQLTAILSRDPGVLPNDPSQIPGLLKFELVMQGGSRIHWGRAPGAHADSLEPSVDQKLARMKSAMPQLLNAPQPVWFDVSNLDFGEVDSGSKR